MADAPDRPISLLPGLIDGRYNERSYLAAFPDVAAAVVCGHLPSGLAHYRLVGRAEMLAGTRDLPGFFEEAAPASPEPLLGRKCMLDFGDARAEFDETLYLALFPDVKDAVAQGVTRGAFEHWLEYGFAEMASGCRQVNFSRPTSPAVPTVRPVEWSPAERLMTFSGAALQPDTAQQVDMPQFRTLRFERLMARPFGVNVFGPFVMESGLGTVARGIVAALGNAGIPLDLWPFDTARGWQTMPGTARRPRFRANLLLVNADTVQHMLAAYPPGTFDDAYNIGVWQWELASACPDMLLALGDIDEIWTSSRFERDAIAAMVPVPVLVVPPPVRVKRAPDGDGPALPGVDDNTFVFVTMLDMASRLQRKNAIAAIEAFIELDPPGAMLLVKLHGLDPEPTNNTTLQHLAVRHPRVILMDTLLTERELTRLRSRADCLLSPHRSEGFGLNIAEFMALGKPVVATNYSGNVDFFDAEVGYPVEYDLVELMVPVPPYPSGYVWAEPRRASLVAQMRDVMADVDKRRRIADAAADRISGSFTVAGTGQTMAARLHELGLRTPLPPFMALANGGNRVMERRSDPGSAFAGMTFSVLWPMEGTAAEGSGILSALVGQTHGGWELLLRPGRSAEPDVQPWLDTLRGSSPRLRVLSSGGPELVEAATCRFVLFAEGPADLPEHLLAMITAILAAEPACDAVSRARTLLVVRKSLLLTMGEHDLVPSTALGPAFLARLASRTRLLRRLTGE